MRAGVPPLPPGAGGPGGFLPDNFSVGRDRRSRLAERAADRGEGVTLRRVFLFQILTPGVVFLALACASHREPPLPTLEDYSDRVSKFTRMYLDDWKAGASDPRFYAEG